MPKNYLYLAKETIKSRQVTVSDASRLFKIHSLTLYDHFNRIRNIKSKTMRRNKTRRPQLEQKFSNSIRTVDKYGLGLSRK